MSSSAGLSAAKRRRTKPSNAPPTNGETEQNMTDTKNEGLISIKDILYLHEKIIHTNDKKVKDSLKNIQKDIDVLISRGKINEKKINDNNSAIETLKKNVGELSLKISNLQANSQLNDDLIKRIELLENKIKIDETRDVEEKLSKVSIDNESDSSEENSNLELND